jgi:hypothetical protein
MREQIQAHLRAIEQAYGILILNRDEVTDWIEEGVQSDEDILTIATALNTWAAISEVSGEIEIPREVVEKSIEVAREEQLIVGGP